jgi:UPF0042 nucleotide-binding protein
MKLIIVSGLSGSGKSVTLDTLEDGGYYCTDNLPVSLLQDFAKLLFGSEKPAFQYAAVGIDARNEPDAFKQFDEVMEKLRQMDINCEVIFLRASQQSLLKRFSETRRKHPLSDENTSLEEAIDEETKRLAPIANHADIQIDTTQTNVHQLRKQIRDRIEFESKQALSLQVQSFGYKHGLPVDVDFVFDARCLPNPYWEPSIREFTGKDSAVIEFLDNSSSVQRYLTDMHQFISNWLPHFANGTRNYLSIAIGCTGGQHRSVYLTEQLAKLLASDDINIIVRHREL